MDVAPAVVARDLLRRWWGLDVGQVSADGQRVDTPSSAQPNREGEENQLCRMALVTDEGRQREQENLRRLCDLLRKNGASGPRSVVASCHLGLTMLAAPMWSRGQFVGALFVHGVHTAHPQMPAAQTPDPPDASSLGLDEAQLRALWATVPTLAPGDIVKARDLLEMAAAEMQRHWHLRGLEAKASAAAAPHPFREIVGDAPAVRELIRLLTKVVASDSTVLIQGESGTGKELIARAIHYHGARAKKNFVVQNCSAFNDNLLESALFGHVRGAFTGAVRDQKGLFEVADGGTFFLDEIGDMSASLQVKLLRVLQEGTFTPVGGTKPVKVDVRIVAASHKDLHAMVQRREFREDLYYRVNVVKLTVPPLRDRIADIPRLVQHFLAKHRRGEQAVHLTEAALDALVRYPWPGNIRELENELERAVVISGDAAVLDLDALSPRVAAVVAAPSSESEWRGRGPDMRTILESVEQEVLLAGLVRTHWDVQKLSDELGMSRALLAQKCRYYGIERATLPAGEQRHDEPGP